MLGLFISSSSCSCGGCLSIGLHSLMGDAIVKSEFLLQTTKVFES